MTEPFDIARNALLASCGNMAYVDVKAVCGMPGIALAWRDRAESFHVTAVVEGLCDGRATRAGRYLRDDDLADCVRLTATRKVLHEREREHLHALLPSLRLPTHPPAPDTGLRRGMASRAVATAGIPEDMRDALRACLDHGVPDAADRLHAYRRPLRRMSAIASYQDVAWPALAFAARNPFLAAFLFSEAWLGRHKPARDPMDLLRERWPEAGEAHLRRLRSIGQAGIDYAGSRYGTGHLELVDALMRLPPDWCPDDGGPDWEALITLAQSAAGAVGNGDRNRMRTLLAPSRGRWKEYEETVFRTQALKESRTDPSRSLDMRSAGLDALDPVKSAARTLVAPLLAHAGRPVATFRAEETAWSLLYGDKGLCAVLDLSARWHAVAAGLEGAVRAGGATEWPALFEDAYDVGGVRVTCVHDRTSLVEEGACGPDRDGIDGLNHCVATRLPNCLAGTAHVLSVRRRMPSGPWMRISTCQVALGKGPDGGLSVQVTEHRGHRNSPPPQDAVAVMAGVLQALRCGGLPVTPEALAPRRTVLDATMRDCGYDWTDPAAVADAMRAWEPLLPRWARGLSPGGLVAEMDARGIVPPLPSREAA